LANWLGIDMTKFRNVDFTNVNDWGNYLLDYAGLKLDHVYDVVRSQLGDGNLVALQKAYDWLNSININDPNGFRTLLTNMQNTMTELQAGAAGLDPSTFIGDLVNKVAGQIPAALARAGANFAAKFVPGMGLAISLYDGLRWVLDNQTQLAALFSQFGSAIDDLASSMNQQDTITAVQAKLLQGFNDSITYLLPLAATQLGLSQLPHEVKKVLNFVPAQVDAAIRKAVDTVASSLPVLPGVIGGTKKDKMFDGMLATPREFQYPETNGSTYILWVAQDKQGAHVRIAKKIAPGVYTRLGDLDSASFTSAVMSDQKTAKQHIDDLIAAAKALHTASKQSTGTTNPLINLQQKQLAVATLTPAAAPNPPNSAEDWVVADIKANACTVLNAGCFAAGTKLLTRSGWRAVETIRPGDEVLSRSEHDPSGSAEWKVVEERFERTGCILHLHVGGEVIRTTPEHPFFVQGEGWKQAGALESGDRIATLSGEWVSVEEVFDTQEWEPVYNLRVADHHTYFVGNEHWGFAAWAHNAVCVAVDRDDSNWNERQVAGHWVYGTAQNTTGSPDDAHAAAINAIVAQLAPQAPAGTYFVLNRTWRTALGRHNVPVPNSAGGTLRPDIIIVQPLGNGQWKVHAVEVMSPGQDRAEMTDRMNDAWRTVNTHRGDIGRGSFKAVPQTEMPNIVW
jgi:hypothetical protein